MTYSARRRRSPTHSCHFTAWIKLHFVQMAVPKTSCRGSVPKRDFQGTNPVKPQKTKRGAFVAEPAPGPAKSGPQNRRWVPRHRNADVYDASGLTRDDA